MSITGEPDGEPQKVGVALVDVLAGLFASGRHPRRAAPPRRDRREGQRVEVDLLSSLLAALVNQAAAYTARRRRPGRMGNAIRASPPTSCCATADGELVLAVGNDRQFAALCEVLGAPELADRPPLRHQPGPGRGPRRAARRARGPARRAQRRRVGGRADRARGPGRDRQRHRPGVRPRRAARPRADGRDPPRRRRHGAPDPKPDPALGHPGELSHRAAGAAGGLTGSRGGRGRVAVLPEPTVDYVVGRLGGAPMAGDGADEARSLERQQARRLGGADRGRPRSLRSSAISPNDSPAR